MDEREDDNEVIQQLYELVSAPSRYDEFMELLEGRLDGIVDRQSTHPSSSTALVEHLKRASELLDVVSPWPLEPSVDLRDVVNLTMQAAFAMDGEGHSRADISPFTRHSIETHRRQGYLGVFSDLNYRDPWRHLLENSQVPIRFVVGENDRNFQWDEAKNWVTRGANLNLDCLPDSGYMVHHQHAHKILEWLKSDSGED